MGVSMNNWAIILCFVSVLVDTEAAKILKISHIRIIGPTDLISTKRIAHTISILKKQLPEISIQHFPAIMNASMTQASLVNRIYYRLQEKVDGKHIQNPSQLGCYLSHVAVWKEIVKTESNNDESYWLVLEDDIVPTSNMIANIKELCHLHCTQYNYINLQPTWNVHDAFFENMVGKCPERQGQEKLCYDLGAQVYLINFEGAKKLLKYVYPPEVAIDWYITMFKDEFDNTFNNAFIPKNQKYPLVSMQSRLSLLDHNCLKCKLPSSNTRLFWVLVLIFTIGLLVGKNSSKLHKSTITKSTLKDFIVKDNV